MNEPVKKIADGIRKRTLIVKEDTVQKAGHPVVIPIPAGRVAASSEAPDARPLDGRISEQGAKGKLEKSATKLAEEEIIIMEVKESKKEDEASLIPPEAQVAPGVVTQKRRHGKGWLGVFGAIVILGGAVILLSTVFARVSVTIKPRVESVSFDDVMVTFDVSASKPDLEEKLIPAERLEFSRIKIAEFPATGRENVREKARGKVKIFNRFSSSPQGLVATTRFVTESGLLYRLVQGITIPGAKIEQGKIIPQFVEAELEADKPGETYNLEGEALLTIPGFKGTPKYEGFYAVAPSGFSGGFEGEAMVVTKDDLAVAQESITKDIFEEVKQEIIRKVPAGFTFAEGLREVEIVRVEAPREKTKREKFPVEVEAKGRILIFRQSDVLSLLKEVVFNKDSFKMLLDDSAKLEYGVRSAALEKGVAEAAIRGEIKTKSVIPEAALAELIRGRKEGSIVATLKSRSDIAAFRISFFPPWIFSAPDDIKKIKFVVE